MEKHIQKHQAILNKKILEIKIESTSMQSAKYHQVTINANWHKNFLICLSKPFFYLIRHH